MSEPNKRGGDILKAKIYLYKKKIESNAEWNGIYLSQYLFVFCLCPTGHLNQSKIDENSNVGNFCSFLLKQLILQGREFIVGDWREESHFCFGGNWKDLNLKSDDLADLWSDYPADEFTC